MHAHILILAAATAIVARLAYVLYTLLTSPLRSLPGPFFARLTKLWYLHSLYKGQAHWDNINLHRRYAKDGEFYAPIVRLGPKMYSITRPDKAVYGIGSRMPKSAWYEGWKHPSPDRWTMFPDRDTKRHAETRRKFHSMYSLTSLLHYEPFVDTVGEVFSTRLREMAVSGKEGIDMHHWLQCYAFDVIGNITYGRRFGFLDEGKDIDRCMTSLESSMMYSTMVGIYAWAHPYLYTFLEKYFPNSGAAGRSYIMSFVRSEVSKREIVRDLAKAEGKRPGPDGEAPRDFLDLALDAEEDPEKGMTKYNVFMMGLSNIIAGSDTTAVSLSSVMWHLATNPSVLSQLRQELDASIAEGKMTREKIMFKESQELPFLQACIKEALRMCAATGLPLWRVVPQGGVEMLGHYFPAGTEVGINIWVAHYDEDIWGRDVKEYKPQRWIEAQADAGRLREMENAFMPVSRYRTCWLDVCGC